MVLRYGPWVARLETNSFSKKTKIRVAASEEGQRTALQTKMRAFNAALKALGSASNMLGFLVERSHSESCLECAWKGNWTRARETKQETRSNQVIWAGPDSRLLAPGAIPSAFTKGHCIWQKYTGSCCQDSHTSPHDFLSLVKCEVMLLPAQRLLPSSTNSTARFALIGLRRHCWLLLARGGARCEEYLQT